MGPSSRVSTTCPQRLHMTCPQIPEAIHFGAVDFTLYCNHHHHYHYRPQPPINLAGGASRQYVTWAWLLLLMIMLLLLLLLLLLLMMILMWYTHRLSDKQRTLHSPYLIGGRQSVLGNSRGCCFWASWISSLPKLAPKLVCVLAALMAQPYLWHGQWNSKRYMTP